MFSVAKQRITRVLLDDFRVDKDDDFFLMDCDFTEFLNMEIIVKNKKRFLFDLYFSKAVIRKDEKVFVNLNSSHFCNKTCFLKYKSDFSLEKIDIFISEIEVFTEKEKIVFPFEFVQTASILSNIFLDRYSFQSECYDIRELFRSQKFKFSFKSEVIFLKLPILNVFYLYFTTTKIYFLKNIIIFIFKVVFCMEL